MTENDDQPSEGLTLAEALERYSDPAAWKAYRAAAAQVPARAPPIPSPYLMSFSDHWPRTPAKMDHEKFSQLRAKRDRLGRELVGAFVAKLRRGELVATGYIVPLQPDAGPVDVAPELWSMLCPNFKTSAAKGGELRLIRVRVRPVEDGVDIGETVAEEAPVPLVRRPGRPSLMSKITAEMRRRAEAGELETTLSAECRSLEKWFKKAHPKWPRPYKWKSLTGPLRPLYNELTGRKK